MIQITENMIIYSLTYNYYDIESLKIIIPGRNSKISGDISNILKYHKLFHPHGAISCDFALPAHPGAIGEVGQTTWVGIL